MRICLGALCALVILVSLVIGPVYLAVSAGQGVPRQTAPCTPGDLTCDTDGTRPAGMPN